MWIRVDSRWLDHPSLADPRALRLYLRLALLAADGELRQQHLTAAWVARDLHVPPAHAQRIVDALFDGDLVSKTETEIEIEQAECWGAFERRAATERQRKSRERLRSASKCDVTVTSPSRHGDGPARARERNVTRRDETNVANATASRACARDGDADAAPETGFALTPPLGTEKELPEQHPDVVAFVAVWTRAHVTGCYPVAFVWPRTPSKRAERAAEIRACMAQSPNWRATLLDALAYPLCRGEVPATAQHPNPKPWGPDKVLKYWDRFVSGEWVPPPLQEEDDGV